MMRIRWDRCIAALLGLFVSAASHAAHPADDSIPLANWAAPPYWAPSAEGARSLEI